MSKPLRSQPTRDRILIEARHLFAARGFERTTIRDVAAASKITPAMVMRYYGSKEDLFAIAATVDFRMPDLRKVPKKARGEALVAHVLERWDAGDELPALLRAAGTHEAARARLVEAVEHQAAAAIGTIVSTQRGNERLAMVVMQIAGLTLSRYVLKHPLVMALDNKTLIRNVGAAILVQMSASTAESDPDTKPQRKRAR